MSFEEWVAEYHKQVETMLGEKIAADLWANEEQRNAVLESGYQSGLPPYDGCVDTLHNVPGNDRGEVRMNFDTWKDAVKEAFFDLNADQPEEADKIWNDEPQARDNSLRTVFEFCADALSPYQIARGITYIFSLSDEELALLDDKLSLL